MKRGIFVFGNYGWLGEYRANSIIAAARRVRPDIGSIDPLVPLDIFHACYLLNTATFEDADEKLVTLVKPILEDGELRALTVADDLVSRVFAVKFLLALAEELEKRKDDLGGMEVVQCLAPAAGGGQAGQGQRLMEAIIAEAAAKAKEKAKGYAEVVKEYVGLKAGVGHAVSFDELLDLSGFAVDVRELSRLFRQLAAIPLPRARVPSPYGSFEGARFGKDLAKVLPSALAWPEELFWYRYATGSLPQVDVRGSAVDRLVLVVDKSGSMAKAQKTLWSRAVALAVAKMVKEAGGEAVLIWFDSEPFAPIDLKREFDRALREVLTLKCDGGTSINRALQAADAYSGYTIVLITDGEDEVTYKPKNRLVSVMVEGDNEALARVSDEYLRVQPTREGALALLSAVRRA